MQDDKFSEIIVDARKRVPGGQLTRDDKCGLIRRGIALGMDEIDVRTMVDAVPPRDRITRGIE